MYDWKLALILIWVVPFVPSSGVAGGSASAAYYVQLIWGTDHAKPPEANFKPVGPKLESQLSHLFRWHHYWEVNRKDIIVKQGSPTRTRLSKDCELEIELVSPTLRETRLYGKGVLVRKVRENIRCQAMSIQGGPTETGGAWFVVIRRDEPSYNLAEKTAL